MCPQRFITCFCHRVHCRWLQPAPRPGIHWLEKLAVFFVFSVPYIAWCGNRLQLHRLEFQTLTFCFKKFEKYHVSYPNKQSKPSCSKTKFYRASSTANQRDIETRQIPEIRTIKKTKTLKEGPLSINQLQYQPYALNSKNRHSTLINKVVSVHN